MGSLPADPYGPLFARYYNQTYDVLRRESGDVDFYRSLAVAAGGPVLELGCGTGRVLLPIAQEGIRCAGVDLSRSMLDILAAEAPPNLTVAHSRMQDFDLGEQRFKLIYAAFRSFQHLYTIEDQLRTLACVRRHLDEGGLLALDVFAPQLDLLSMTRTVEREDAHFNDGDTEVMRSVATSVDHARQMMELKIRFERREPNGSVRSDVEEAQLRYFFRYELEHLLARAGFDKVEVFGGFDRRSYNYVSGETVVVARL